jgi:hypothetical protein
MVKEDIFKLAKPSEYIIKTFKKDEFIYPYGWDKKVGYVLSGKVMIFKHFTTKSITYPCEYQTGELVGMGFYFFDNENKYAFDFKAKTDNTEIAFLKESLVIKLLQRKDFLELILRLNEKKELNSVGLTIFLMFGPLGYFAYILVLKNKNGIVKFDRFLDYCDYLNVNKSRLYDMTNKLIGENIIEKNNKEIKILNMKKLKEYFEGE